MKIFIVDNSKTGWKRIRNLLDTVSDVELTGSDVNTNETLHNIEAVKPDVLILDIDMPLKKGIELLHQLIREHAFLAVIVLTDASSSFFRRKCIEAGARFFFDKATEFDKVPQAIEILQRDLHHSSN